MDLFLDNYYKLNSENKINYHSVLYDPTTTIPEGYTKVGSGTIIEVTETHALIAREATDMHIIRDSDGLYCHEYLIAQEGVKKFILE